MRHRTFKSGLATGIIFWMQDHSQQRDSQHSHSHEEKIEDGFFSKILHFFKPHSHDSADSIDNALVGSQEGIKAVKNSLLILGATAFLQLFVVIFTGSIALLADTIHNFADASTSIPLWLAFSLGKKKPNQKYTYGFGRAEDIAGIFIIVMIAISSVVAFWEAFQRLLHPHLVTNLIWVASAAILGFLGNEIVAQYRIRTGQKIGSAALIADGYHARTDGFTSLAVLAGAAGVWLGFPQADPLVGMGITVAIAFVLKSAATRIWHRLMDAVDPHLIEDARHTITHIQGVHSVSALRMRWVGHSLQADTEIVADGNLPLKAAHDLAEEVRHQLLHSVPKLEKVLVHIDPLPSNGKNHHEKVAHHESGSVV